MGKKKAEEMAKQRSSFVEGCQRVSGIPAAEANKIFDVLEKFAGYGFNKSHAAAYALVAYQTAYLKANHPVEFFAEMMTNDLGDTDKLAEYVAEAKALGIEVRPPDVNESGVHFAPAPRPAGTDARAIRFGLAAVKGMGEIAVQGLLDARAQHGRFTSLTSLCEHVDTRTVNRKALEALVKCGACDGLGGTRAGLFAQIERALARGQHAAQDRARGQSSLFGVLAEPAAPAEGGFANLPEWPLLQRLADEKALLGFYVTGHPLDPHRGVLERYGLATTATLAALPSRAVTRLGGLVSAVQQGVSKKSGKPYALVTLEDLAGTVQLLCMNEAHDRFRELFTVGRAVFVTGEVGTGEDQPKLFPQEIWPLEEAPRRLTEKVFLRVAAARADAALLHAARELVAAHPGRVPLFLCLVQPGGERVFIEANDRYAVTASLELQQAVEAMLGPGSYHAKADPSLPECARRKWERGGGDEG
jgi:DNA polymerase-3 subunit alpha